LIFNFEKNEEEKKSKNFAVAFAITYH